MEVVLVRHGETDWNLDGRLMGQKDVPLNDKGREQAAGDSRHPCQALWQRRLE